MAFGHRGVSTLRLTTTKHAGMMRTRFARIARIGRCGSWNHGPCDVHISDLGNDSFTHFDSLPTAYETAGLTVFPMTSKSNNPVLSPSFL